MHPSPRWKQSRVSQKSVAKCIPEHRNILPQIRARFHARHAGKLTVA